MSTARRLHLHDDAQWPITIQPDGTVPAANQFMTIGSSDSIDFTNDAPFPVKIVFTSVFNTINPLPPRGNSGPQGGGNPLGTTINFTIYNASTGVQTGGPYAVQFGIGPLEIRITSLTPSPDPIAVPKGGEIQFTTDAGYNINWSANAWTPQPATLSQGLNSPPQKALPSANGQNLSYTLSLIQGTQGRGTVKIGT